MADEEEKTYLCVMEIQEAREGNFLLPNRKIEFKIRRKKDEDAASFAGKMLKEEVNRAREKGTVIHQNLVVYKQITKEK